MFIISISMSIFLFMGGEGASQFCNTRLGDRNRCHSSYKPVSIWLLYFISPIWLIFVVSNYLDGNHVDYPKKRKTKLWIALWSISNVNVHLERGKMYQIENPVGSIKPKILVAWLYHWSTFDECSSILNFLSHLHDNKFKLCAH